MPGRSSPVGVRVIYLRQVRQVERRTLAMLVAIGEEGAMSRAAQRLHLSQPALSKQLAQVERSTGLILFERHAKGMTPTATGRVLIDRARALLRELDNFSDILQKTRGELQGLLTIGYLAQTINDDTRGLIDEFEQQHPAVTVHKRQYDLRDMTAGLMSGETDIALLRQPLDQPQLVHETAFVEPRVAVLYPSHPAAAAPSTTLAQLFGTPWVVNATTDRAFREYQLALAARGNKPPILGPVVHTTDEFLEAVMSRKAIGLAPASAARYYARPGVVYLPVLDAPPSECSLSWRRDRPAPPAAAAFIDHLRRRLPVTFDHAWPMPEA
jgi:DNA-binding transcriptional LysR family regulator